MPIYEFDCSVCGHVFERLQKLSDADPTDCPACHAAAVKRRLSAPSFRLSGSGWYETDFKSDKDKKRNLTGGDDAAKPSSGDGAGKAAEAKTGETKSSTTDSKPAPAASSTTASTTASS